MTLLAFFLLIGPIIFVHELGHLIAAKLVGVEVRRFSIGFGRPFARIRLGETEYCLAPIPLGGYVQMTGQQGQEADTPEQQARSLSDKPLWAKLVVLAAGPLANFVLPFVIYFFIFLGQTTQYPASVGSVLDGSPANAAGLQTGDRITAIDDENIASWDAMVRIVSRSPERELHLQIERDGQRIERFVTPRRATRRNDLGDREDVGRLGILMHSYAPQLAIVDPRSPAAQEGLRDGDIITSFNGEPVVTVEDLERHLTRTSDSLIRLTYLRAEEADSPIGTALVYRSYHAQILPRKDSGLAVGIVAANTSVRSVTPGRAAFNAGIRRGDRILAVNGAPLSRWESLQGELLRAPERGSTLDVQSPGSEARQVSIDLDLGALRDECGSRLDCYLGATPYRTVHLPDEVPIRGRGSFALRAAWHQTTGKIGELWLAIRRMITLERGIDDLSSVVGIFYIAGIIAPQGAGPFLDMMAYLSLSIGVLNFLPIPVLDGGHILLYAVESIRRRPLSQRAREIASTVGLVIVLLLLLVGLRNDIVRFWMN